MAKSINTVAIIGTGVVGASWAALFLAKGLKVVATDVAPDADASLRHFVEAAWPALKRLGLAPGASQSNLKFTADLPTAVKNADFVQENGPERIDFKKKLYAQLDDLLSADVIIASSSSGLTMSEIQSDCTSHPERCVIGHPFNPPHLVPLVESSAEQRLQRIRFSAPPNSIRRSGSGQFAFTRKCLGMSLTGCRQLWAGRYIISLQKGSSASPTSTRPCAGGPGYVGALWGKSSLITSAVARAALSTFSRSLRVP
jgi:hypothetical protein